MPSNEDTSRMFSRKKSRTLLHVLAGLSIFIGCFSSETLEAETPAPAGEVRGRIPLLERADLTCADASAVLARAIYSEETLLRKIAEKGRVLGGPSSIVERTNAATWLWVLANSSRPAVSQAARDELVQRLLIDLAGESGNGRSSLLKKVASLLARQAALESEPQPLDTDKQNELEAIKRNLRFDLDALARYHATQIDRRKNAIDALKINLGEILRDIELAQESKNAEELKRLNKIRQNLEQTLYHAKLMLRLHTEFQKELEPKVTKPSN